METVSTEKPKIKKHCVAIPDEAKAVYRSYSRKYKAPQYEMNLLLCTRAKSISRTCCSKIDAAALKSKTVRESGLLIRQLLIN